MDDIHQSEKKALSEVLTVQQDPDKLAKSFWLRWVYIVLAWLCIVIAFFGLFIPGLPPFDFLMLASFFAAKGSPRLHRWFQENRYIGPLLREWQQHRRIPRKMKIFSMISMTVAAGIIIWKIQHLWLVIALITSMICVQIWMWSKT
ncbi:hypothetical protein EC844_10217 [Acinetobacter calcoaceticus]|uniref:Inner membrane protein YbaN n=1 Tax=Acinetobacter calcoaceticus TaxID=471 RepID=A0A4V2R1T4_ACICA|nr:hypothetical protein EC844_10217 [Acinetobacter calcoaceticus]